MVRGKTGISACGGGIGEARLRIPRLSLHQLGHHIINLREDGRPIIYWVAARGDADKVAFLGRIIRERDWLHFPDSEFWSAFIGASEMGHCEIIRLLVEELGYRPRRNEIFAFTSPHKATQIYIVSVMPQSRDFSMAIYGALQRRDAEMAQFFYHLGERPTTPLVKGLFVPESITEDEMAETRYRCYFSRSLVWNLLFRGLLS